MSTYLSGWHLIPCRKENEVECPLWSVVYEDKQGRRTEIKVCTRRAAEKESEDLK